MIFFKKRKEQRDLERQQKEFELTIDNPLKNFVEDVRDGLQTQGFSMEALSGKKEFRVSYFANSIKKFDGESMPGRPIKIPLISLTADTYQCPLSLSPENRYFFRYSVLFEGRNKIEQELQKSVLESIFVKGKAWYIYGEGAYTPPSRNPYGFYGVHYHLSSLPSKIKIVSDITSMAVGYNDERNKNRDIIDRLSENEQEWVAILREFEKTHRK